MGIVKTKTTDQQGNIYEKVFSNFSQGAIICDGLNNKKLLIRPNISIRKGGKGKFGEEIVFQFVIEKVLELYKSKSPKPHIETYFEINDETYEFFKEITILIEDEINNGPTKNKKTTTG